MTIIAAMDRNRLIGCDNRLPWRLSADLQNFKKLTSGNAIIMGRKTWDSLGRALPHRKNIVITRDPDFDVDGAEVVHSVTQALQIAGKMKPYVIGGGQVYKLLLPQVSEMILTHVEAELEGDTWFPEYKPGDWQLMESEAFVADEKNQYSFTVARYVRK